MFKFFSLDRDDYTALAFKPTVPSNQNENQLLQQQQQPLQEQQLPSSELFSEDYILVTQWGSNGTGDGQFKYPEDIALDSKGNVYVADMGNSRIQKFDSNGNFITKWGSFCSISSGQPQCIDPDGDSGSLLLGDGQFESIDGIAIDPKTNNVYVTDAGNYHIQVFAPSSISGSN